MPIYSSHIAAPRLPNFRRIGYHIKSTKTNSATSVFNFEQGETARPSLSLRRGKFGPKSSFEGATAARTSMRSLDGGADIGLKIESPPLVFYGSPKDSTGALLSGLIHIQNDSRIDWSSFTLTLEAETYTRRPIHTGCADCSKATDLINQWTLISSRTGSGKDRLTYPFSYLIPGHLPASTNNSLIQITYYLVAEAISIDGDELHFRQPITIERAILPGPERTSVRIFPPTNLSANVKLPSVVHPGGDFVFDLRLDGVVSKERNTRWRLRQIQWRIDENTRAVSPACKLHCARLGGEGKGVAHQDTRSVGYGELKRGWKSDFDTENGTIEMQVVAGIPVHRHAACNLETPNGAVVDHVLVVELIVVEENRPGPNRAVTPTGGARVLRMQFQLVVTGRSGLGISWDEESPPVYDDVPESPPNYGVPDQSLVLSYADFPPVEPESRAE